MTRSTGISLSDLELPRNTEGQKTSWYLTDANRDFVAHTLDLLAALLVFVHYNLVHAPSVNCEMDPVLNLASILLAKSADQSVAVQLLSSKFLNPFARHDSASDHTRWG